MDYIFGNPPFVSAKSKNDTQKLSFNKVMHKVKNKGNLDFVSAWFIKSLNMMKRNEKIEAVLVSTNSVVQGEQATILWKYMFEHHIFINYAHQSFLWDNKGAYVYCAIIGFLLTNKKQKNYMYMRIINSQKRKKYHGLISIYLITNQYL